MKSLVRFLLLSVFLAMAAYSFGQTKRALLVGVDIYKPVDVAVVEKTRGAWTNLDGCVNDAKSIAEIIKSRFGFEEKNIATLYDQDAKREKILAAIEKLIDESQKGDVVFIYYAGHGSQVYNSLSTEVSGDKQDETIVPADMMDIRDKELAKLFNRLLDKGVILTLIFDSCHSGSIARGSNVPEIAKSRHINGSSADAMDPSDPQKPEDRGALIYSAAQPEQLAKEALDDQGNPHGAFTVALVKALNSSPFNEPADMMFLRLKAIMQANGSTQEPVLGANEIRRKQGLFGEDLSAAAGKTIVAVTKNAGAEDIELQGGWAIGLNANCELKKMGADSKEKIIITQVNGMAKCKAKLKEGDIARIKSGDLFEITTWAEANTPNLRVWFPANNFTSDDILKVAKNFAAIANNKSYTWVTDPAKQAPRYIIQFFDDSWKLSGPSDKIEDLGKNPTMESVLKKIPRNNSVFLQLPPPVELVNSIKLGAGTDNSAIEITRDPMKADYILTGMYENQVLKYAWVEPNLTDQDSTFLSTLPVRTNWFEAKRPEDLKTVGENLTQFAIRLGKINAWLNLSSPPDDGSFPFSLALKNLSTGKYAVSGTVYGGEKYGLVLLTTKEQLKKWSGNSRYIYVFTIDVSGHTQQIFPYANTGNEGNKLPNKTYDSEEEISLGQANFTIGVPYGVDSYFLITSDEAINNFQAFNSEGVITRGAGSGNPLENLLGGVGAATRGISANTVPANWSFQRISITSKP
jgi:hypothetical protein